MRFFKRYFNNTQPILARLLLAGLLLQSCGDNLPQPTNPNNSPHPIVSVSGAGRSIAAYSIQTTPSSVPPQPMLWTVQPTVMHSIVQPAAPVVQIIQQTINLAPQHISWTGQPTVVSPIVQVPQPMQAVQQHNTIFVPTQPVIWTNQPTVSSPIGQPIPYPMQAIPQTTSLSLPSTVMPAQPSRANVAVGHQGSIHASYRPLYPKDASTVYPTSHVGKTRQAGNSKRKFGQMVQGEKGIFASQVQTSTDKRPRYLAATQQVSVKIEKEAESTDQYNISTSQKTPIKERKHSIVKQETKSSVKDQLELEKMLQEAIDELDHRYSLNTNHPSEISRKTDHQESDNSYFLPPEMIEHVLSFLPLEEVLNVRRWSKYFCRLIGDYPVLGGIGVQNKLLGALHIPSLKKKYTVNCSPDPGETDRHTFINFNDSSSFFFYQLLGSIKNLPVAYWPYIKGTSIHTLHFNCYRYKDIGLSGLFEYLDQTEVSKIGLRGYDNLSDEQITAFVTAMSASRVKKLKLHYAFSFKSESKNTLFINMLSSNSSIEGLTLSNIWRSQNMKQLAAVLPQSKIKKLKLISIELTDDAIMILANVLPKTQVEVLDLSYAHISTLGVRHLAHALTNSKVKRLSLANNQGIHAIDISILASMLPSTKLEELDLTGKRINSTGVQALAAVLPNTKLKKINLSQNPIDDNAVLALASVLPNSHVEEIHLCSDDIQIPGVNAIIKVLASSRIKRLYLGSSNITPKFTQDIATALQNSQVEEFHLYSKKLPLPQAVAFIRKLVNTPVKIVGLKFGNIIHQAHPSMLTDALKTTNIRKVFLSRTVGKIDPLLQLQFKKGTAPLNIEWVFNANESY